MAKQFEIRFGPTDKTVFGKSVEEARQRTIRANEARSNRALTEDERALIEENLVGQAENEKSILIACLDAYVKHVKHDLGTLAEVTDIVRDIRNATGVLRCTQHELDLMRQGLDKMDEKELAHSSAWLEYGELFAQLASPTAAPTPEEKPDDKT